MCAILQLVSAPLNPTPIAEHFRRSHPQCEHSYGQHIYMSKENNALDSGTRATTSTTFSHRATLCARKPTSFWREKRGAVVILERGLAKMLWRQNKSRTW